MAAWRARGAVPTLTALNQLQNQDPTKEQIVESKILKTLKNNLSVLKDVINVEKFTRDQVEMIKNKVN